MQEIITNKQMNVFGFELGENSVLKIEDKNVITLTCERLEGVFINPVTLKQQQCSNKCSMIINTKKYGKTQLEFIAEVIRLNDLKE
jgi:hypothetical protein